MITWSKTIELLCLSVVSGVKDRKFICPIFGTLHHLVKFKNEDTLFFHYRGYNYYMIKFWNNVYKMHMWVVGLRIGTTDSNSAYRPIMVLSDDLKFKTYYDINGKEKTTIIS